MVLQLQLRLGVLGQKITDLLIVNFKERGSDKERLCRGRVDVLEDVLERARDHSSGLGRDAAHHGEGFACASLAVGKNRPVVAILSA